MLVTTGVNICIMSGVNELTVTMYREDLERALEQAFDEFRTVLPEVISPQADWALATMREYSLRPGKRVRGSLAVVTALHTGSGVNKDQAVRIGCVVELLHDYLLIVDDVMDKSALRRGKPTVHLLYQKQYGAQVSEFEAEMVAINVGLLVQHMASWLLAGVEADAAAHAQLGKIVHSNIAVTGLGQIDDTFQQIGRMNTDTSDILRKYQQKSGYYTFINPLQCGLALSGKYDPAAQQAAERYGLSAGVAFQLNDDYEGLFGKSGETGKENLDDIRDGKFTLLIQQGLSSASEDDKTTLVHLIGKADATTADLETVRAILKRSGAAGYVRNEARGYAAQAKQAAREGEAVWGKDFALLLEQLADTVIGELAHE